MITNTLNGLIYWIELYIEVEKHNLHFKELSLYKLIHYMETTVLSQQMSKIFRNLSLFNSMIECFAFVWLTFGAHLKLMKQIDYQMPVWATFYGWFGGLQQYHSFLHQNVLHKI